MEVQVAYEWNPDALFRAAALAISKGIWVARLYGMTEDGRCTCGNPDHRVGGPAELQCGKHPRGKDWANRAATTEDEILEWLEEGTPFNIGAVLGPRSGIIDMEWDDEKAKAYAETLGLTTVETPTYISGRSEHRLFLWDDRLSECNAVVHPGGLEVRLGTGLKSSQSVLPPSWHWSGVQYRWKPGFSMEDLPFAPLPDVLLRAIVNDADLGAGQRSASAVSSRAVLHGDVGKGSRHPSLLSYVTRKVFGHPKYLRDSVQADMLVEIELVNERRCKPPKTSDEVRAMFYSVVEYRRRMEARGEETPEDDDEIEKVAAKIEEKGNEAQQVPVSGYSLHGLKWAPVDGWPAGEWLPGDWSIQVVHGDPAEIVLRVPAWKNTPCKGKVAFSFADFRSAKLVAAKVFEATRRVILDGDGKLWQIVWRGQEGNSKRPRLAGLIEKLLLAKQKADDVHVGAASLRYATLAAYLLEALARAKPPSEEKPEPEKSGRPRWVTSRELWLGWSKTWEEIGRAHDVAAGERVRIKRMLLDRLGVEDFVERRHTFGGHKQSYVVLTPEWIEAIQQLAEGAPEATAAPEQAEDGLPPNTGMSEKNCGKKIRQNTRL